jgi:hypothetical protein
MTMVQWLKYMQLIKYHQKHNTYILVQLTDNYYTHDQSNTTV